ncbi:MAG: multiheme c-type cytochrome [Planctomycetota bacterium]
MTLAQKNWIIAALGLLLVAMLVVVSYREAQSIRHEAQPEAVVTDVNRGCVDCHGVQTPVITAQWKDSTHGEKGVGCVECHQAEEGEPDAFRHEGQWIATIVTPKDCARCHAEVVEEFQGSHHAAAGKILHSLDNVLGEFAEGPAAAANGCWQCHGSEVKLLKDEAGNVMRRDSGAPRFDPLTWPNTGVGRLNLDGTRGSCAACHSRHSFKRAVARSPENCGKCHLGPDHPQKEIYDESKHGIAFYAHRHEMNLDSKTWIAGQDYIAAPTCATCHMSATKSQPITHDPGKRLSWTLRPPVSVHQQDWEGKRQAMQEVCSACHIRSFYEDFYVQFDSAIELYNDKFAIPGSQLMAMLYSKDKLTATPFDEELEWTWFRLWHHEGRRARHGASMQGPDYTQWHGFFEVAENFYTKFLDQVHEAAQGDEEILAKVEEILARPEHAWRSGGLPEEMMKRIDEEYRAKYKQSATGER